MFAFLRLLSLVHFGIWLYAGFDLDIKQTKTVWIDDNIFLHCSRTPVLLVGRERSKCLVYSGFIYFCKIFAKSSNLKS